MKRRPGKPNRLTKRGPNGGWREENTKGTKKVHNAG